MSNHDQQTAPLGRSIPAVDKAANYCLRTGVKPATAAKIYGANPISVRGRFYRQRESANGRQRRSGGHNKVLREDQELALFKYVTDEATEGLGVTKRILFAAICHLRRKEGKPDPSWRWFQKWRKAHENDLHTIKTKPIAATRIETHTEDTVTEWFTELRRVMEERGIRRASQVYNFDETGVRLWLRWIRGSVGAYLDERKVHVKPGESRFRFSC